MEMPKIDVENVPEIIGSTYPFPLDQPCADRRMKMLGDAGGLSQFGAHQVTLPPGVWASQRHWHSADDEFVYIISGHCVLIDDNGETPLQAGDACAHKAGDPNAHHVVNNSDADVVFLAVGSRRTENDHCHYAEADLDLPANGTQTRNPHHKDGSPY
jgi:uncharacterized cupin superfamily protein